MKISNKKNILCNNINNELMLVLRRFYTESLSNPICIVWVRNAMGMLASLIACKIIFELEK